MLSLWRWNWSIWTQQSTLEKKISEKESEMLELHLKLREKSDEITHLKTREMSLIDKSDTLKKGRIMNIIYYMWFKYLILSECTVVLSM